MKPDAGRVVDLHTLEAEDSVRVCEEHTVSCGVIDRNVTEQTVGGARNHGGNRDAVAGGILNLEPGEVGL